ncbi:MAG: ribonuclease P protein component [Pseudomonadota bacterium]
MQGIKTLKQRSEYVFVRHGDHERRRTVVIQARNRPDSEVLRAGFTATRKIGNAVVRNRAKRRLRAAARQCLPQFGVPGADYVFIARRDTAEIAWTRLLDDMESALLSLAGQLGAAHSPA